MPPVWTIARLPFLRTTKRRYTLSFLISLATVFLLSRAVPVLADQPFSWQSVSFDGGPAFLLGGSVSGFLNGKPVASTNLLDLENNGMMFHVRWGSYVLPHLGLRFSVGYETFSANRGFSGLSGMPLTVGATVPLRDPRSESHSVIPYFAADLGPSFNSLSTNAGNAGSVSFTADAGAGVMVRLSGRVSLYGEAVGTYVDSPISTRGLASSSSNLSSGPLWFLPVVFGVTYEFRTPGEAPAS
ncbi:MAG: protein of unknown function [Leptospirillum rubarum]|jgi:hypothetical protein|nr:MAG: protein of unknown function [Leptospirillum rubarum]